MDIQFTTGQNQLLHGPCQCGGSYAAVSGSQTTVIEVSGKGEVSFLGGNAYTWVDTKELESATRLYSAASRSYVCAPRCGSLHLRCSCNYLPSRQPRFKASTVIPVLGTVRARVENLSKEAVVGKPDEGTGEGLFSLYRR